MATVKKKHVVIQDNEKRNIKDYLTTGTRKNGPGGFVSIVDKKTGEVLVDKKEIILSDPDQPVAGKDNLIVYSGRQIAVQRMFNINRTALSGEKDLFISWFSVGSGGADPADPLTPISPTSNDVDLSSEIVIDDEDPTNADSGKKKNFDIDAEILQDSSNNNKYLIAKATITLQDTDANGNNLNEAALWLSDSSDVAEVTTFVLWARVTFSSIQKSDQRELIFLWYVYF